jgi:hypothetical protein
MPQRFLGLSKRTGCVGRVDVDFLSGPKPTGTYHESSKELVAEKKHFGESRLVRDTSLVGSPADQ